MRMLQVARGIAWLGAIIVWWSMNLVWGTDPNLPKGPPGQWQRHVVGAGLLALIAAVALMASGRNGKPPSWTARGIAGGCAAAILAIALYLRADADFADLVAGAGWTWLLAGGGFVLSAATLTFGLKPAPDKKPSPSGGKRRKKKSRKG